MASLNQIEQCIFEVDGIRASLSGTANGHPDYWTNRFNGDKKLGDFRTRFSQRYPDVGIVLYDGTGYNAHGNYLLKNLRSTYEFSWIQERADLYLECIYQQQEHIAALKNDLAQLAQAGAATPEEPDPYDILGVDRCSSDEQIKQAFQRKISRVHPDKFQGLDQAIVEFGTKRAQLINRARDRIVEDRAAPPAV